MRSPILLFLLVSLLLPACDTSGLSDGQGDAGTPDLAEPGDGATPADVDLAMKPRTDAAGADMTAPPMTVPPDLTVPPEMMVPEDMTAPPDMTVPPDMTRPADLTPAPDLGPRLCILDDPSSLLDDCILSQ